MGIPSEAGTWCYFTQYEFCILPFPASKSKLGTAVVRVTAGGSPLLCAVLYMGIWKKIMLKATLVIVAGRGVDLAPQEPVPVIISIQLSRGMRDHALKGVFHGEALRKCCLVWLHGTIPLSLFILKQRLSCPPKA